MIECLDPDCQKTFDSEMGMKSHLGHMHDIEQLLIDDIVQFHHDIGHVPTIDEITEYGEFSRRTFIKRFGTWNRALQQAGFEENKHHNIPTDSLVDELRDLADTLGKTPTVEQMDNMGKYTAPTYQERFGSWNDAVRAAGLSTNHREDMTKDELEQAVMDLHDETGHIPTYNDMLHNGEFSPYIYEKEYGSWISALRECGFEVDDSLEPAGHKFGRNWAASRNAAVCRDNGRCRLCGRRDAEETTLDVHHIKPRVQYIDEDGLAPEANELSNLITLCKSCHSGNLESKERLWDLNPDQFVELLTG